MNNSKVLIIEDEKLFADNLEEILLQLFNDIVIAAKIRSIEDAVNWFKINQADLIFMDIHLSDGLSFEILNKVEISTPIIFITSFDQYAIRAFEHNSVGYIVKPPKVDDIRKAVEKYIKYNQQLDTINYQQLINSLNRTNIEYKQRFVINVGRKIKIIPTKEIAYFFINNKSCFLCSFNNKHFPIEYSLDKLDQILDPELFFRINRNYIINLESIKDLYILSKSRIKVELNPPSADMVIVSLSRCSSFRKWINR